MDLLHRDKSIKLSANGRATLDRQIARADALALTDEEASAIGYRVAQQAEAASRMPAMAKMNAAGLPLPAEVAELERAEAALAAASRETRKARAEVAELEGRARALWAAGYWDEHADASDQRELRRTQADLKAAELRWELLRQAEAPLEQAASRARGAILHNGAARQRQWVADGGLR